MGTTVIVVISYDQTMGFWDACIKVPTGWTEDETYCAWVRKTNRFGWKDKSNDFILSHTTDAYDDGYLQDSLLDAFRHAPIV